jgi:2-polyprenyl-6-hydroxyphenyl methylase/3-demethylubiquinone-9 3-methyltransferase
MPAPGVIDEEVERFASLGERWWSATGPMAALHRINPLRLAWTLDAIVGHFRRARGGDAPPLSGLTLLDVGCGGGLYAEPLSRLGAEVVGLDPGEASIAAARAHAEATGARLAYRVGTVEDLAREGARFDVATAMEVVEHVPDLDAFVAAATALIAPGGLFLASTVNRTLASFALAIVGAEYVLRWVPRGSHRWERFVTPDEFSAALGAAGFTTIERRGMRYDPLGGEWRLSRDLSVNYLIAARRG